MIILASASPRRRELLARLGLPFRVVEPQVDEEGLEGRPERVARRRPIVDHAVTRVTMRRYTDAEIDACIARGDPFDKAGAYAMQDERLAPWPASTVATATSWACLCGRHCGCFRGRGSI